MNYNPLLAVIVWLTLVAIVAMLIEWLWAEGDNGWKDYLDGDWRD